MISKEEIKKQFERGVDMDCDYMIIACDTFYYSDYPVFLKSSEYFEWKDSAQKDSVTRIMEVYDLNADKNKQLDECRAMNEPSEPQIRTQGVVMTPDQSEPEQWKEGDRLTDGENEVIFDYYCDGFREEFYDKFCDHHYCRNWKKVEPTGIQWNNPPNPTEDHIADDFISARAIQHELGYAQWRNFESALRRAKSIITHRHIDAKIEETALEVSIGSRATREVVDYSLDQKAFEIVEELTNSYKLNKCFSARSETVVLSLVKKYCDEKGLDFEFQHRSGDHIFDCLVNNEIFIEFDEDQHNWDNRQKEIDSKKDDHVKSLGLKIYRIDLDMDIIDVILYLENNISIKPQPPARVPQLWEIIDGETCWLISILESRWGKPSVGCWDINLIQRDWKFIGTIDLSLLEGGSKDG